MWLRPGAPDFVLALWFVSGPATLHALVLLLKHKHVRHRKLGLSVSVAVLAVYAWELYVILFEGDLALWDMLVN